jgi:hypothetical protein
LLPKEQAVAVGGFRFLQPARGLEQVAEVVVASGQCLAELGAGGEVGGQSLQEGQSVGVGRLRFLQITETGTYPTDAIVPFGPDESALGIVGRQGGKAFKVLDDLPQERLVLSVKVAPRAI